MKKMSYPILKLSYTDESNHRSDSCLYLVLTVLQLELSVSHIDVFCQKHKDNFFCELSDSSYILRRKIPNARSGSWRCVAPDSLIS
jgi:hypothetical protein